MSVSVNSLSRNFFFFFLVPGSLSAFVNTSSPLQIKKEKNGGLRFKEKMTTLTTCGRADRETLPRVPPDTLRNGFIWYSLVVRINYRVYTAPGTYVFRVYFFSVSARSRKRDSFLLPSFLPLNLRRVRPSSHSYGERERRVCVRVASVAKRQTFSTTVRARFKQSGNRQVQRF